MDGQDVHIPSVFYRTLSPSVPSGAAAQKRKRVDSRSNEIVFKELIISSLLILCILDLLLKDKIHCPLELVKTEIHCS